jgi:hypothetical protein
MGSFDGKLRMPGEEGPVLRVTIDLTEGEMAMSADSGELARWPRDQVVVNALPDGFHVRAEGELVILDVGDDAEFAVELGLTTAPPLLRRKMASLLRDRG